MKKYLQSVFERLQYEAKSDFPVMSRKWLLELLSENDWRIPATKANFVCRKLGIDFDEPSYYRDIVVWLPDLRFHVDPPCPNCGRGCKFHCWQTNHFGRVVISLYDHYFVISRRYLCTHCEEETQQKKDNENKTVRFVLLQGGETASGQGATVEAIVNENPPDEMGDISTGSIANNKPSSKEPPQYTFMGYNARSRELLPYGFGSLFPAFFTHKGAVDMTIIDLMRPLFNVGVRPEQLAAILLELASKKYHQRYLHRELDIRRVRDADIQKDYKKGQLYSEFKDKDGYGAVVPSGKYLAHVYKLHGETIKDFLEREVKKRGAEYLRWDVSYKEAKKLCRYKGKPVFKALVSATNEIGEIRIQFHIVTDGHEQMVHAIREFHKTTVAYGQCHTKIVFSDKPAEDFAFFCNGLPGVMAFQKQLDAMQKEAPSVECAEPVARCQVNLENVQLVSSITDINIKMSALLDHLKDQPINERIVALDTEYEYGSKLVFPPKGKDKVALIQLAYETRPGKINAILIQCRHLRELPDALVRLFKEPSIVYVGSKVKGDITKLGEDFGIKEVSGGMRYTELAKMAKDRGRVPDAKVGLQTLVMVVLRESMGKEDDVRSSKWAKKQLSDEQKTYAALDAIKSLEVYAKLQSFPDLTERLASAEAKAGVLTDIVAPHGKVGSDGMGTVGALGTILEGEAWDPPPNIKRTRRRKEPKRVVTVSKVFAPNLKVDGYKVEENGVSRPACIDDFAVSKPFKVELPLTMLKRHDPETMKLSEPSNVQTNEGESLDGQWVRGDDDEDGLSIGGTEVRVPSTQGENEERAQSSNAEEKSWYEIGIDERKDMTKEEIAELRQVLTIANECRNIGNGHKLDEPPAAIVDAYRSVLGDGFHGMDRPKVPVNHDAKKGYYVAFQEAFFAWDPKKLAEVKGVLRKSGMKDEEIEAKMYYDADFFVECVFRAVLPPRLLYWRIRSVFAVWGTKVDGVTGKPLFNKRAWKKANNLLKEILKGCYSDPPGISFYIQKLDKNGEPRTNRYGLPLYWCLRGTNLTEVVHKQMLMGIGTWATGIEMSDCLRAEHRHRYNHHMSERRRDGFPRIGHVDTWLVDAIQLLVEENHNVLLYPTWTNTADFIQTTETFGTVPLQSQELTKRVNELKLSPKLRLTREQRYLAKKQGVQVPFTPFVGKEKKVVRTMLLEGSDPNDEDQLTLDWLKHVDGKEIMPKLGVYFRTYIKRYTRNRRIEAAMKAMADETDKLKSINAALLPPTDEQEQQSDSFAPLEEADEDEVVTPATGAVTGMQQPRHWPEPLQPPAFQPPVAVVLPSPVEYVGGIQIGFNANAPLNTATQPRKRGGRSQDRAPRKKRTCQRCTRNNGEYAHICPGRAPRVGEKGCQYFPPPAENP
jgi:hypothetical protein